MLWYVFFLPLESSYQEDRLQMLGQPLGYTWCWGKSWCPLYWPVGWKGQVSIRNQTLKTLHLEMTHQGREATSTPSRIFSWSHVCRSQRRSWFPELSSSNNCYCCFPLEQFVSLRSLLRNLVSIKQNTLNVLVIQKVLLYLSLTFTKNSVIIFIYNRE